MPTKLRFISTSKKPPLPPHKVYQLGGTDTKTPDELLSTGMSPYLRNVRYKSRGTIITRKGPSPYSIPTGQTQNASQTGTATGNQSVSTTLRQAAKFTATATERLTCVELQLKTTTPAATGEIIVEVYTDSSGPSTLLASGYISSGSVTASYQYLRAWFNNPPAVTNGSSYWIVAYIQSGGTNAYLWASATGSTSKTSTSGGAWTAAAYDLTYKTYTAPNRPVLGRPKRVKFASGSKYTVFANVSGVWTVNDITGVVTQIFSGSSSASRYVFEFYNDVLYWVNGYDAPQQWNGITQAAVAGSPPIATDVIEHKNQLFFVSASDPTKVVFSEPGDPTSYLSVNFFYVPTPKSSDYIQKMLKNLGGNLWLRTRRGRYVLYGSDLSTYRLERALAFTGVINGSCTVVHQNFEYCVTNDGIERFNGATAEIISQRVQPDFEAITDRDTMSLDVQGNYLRVYYPGTGSSTNSECFVYDLLNDQWFIDSGT